MSVNFKVNIPDEPFKSTTTENKQEDCVYVGKRYVLAVYDNSTGVVEYSIGSYDTLDDFDISDHQEIGKTVIVIDSVTHPFEASYITHSYTSEANDGFTETLPNGDVYTYPHFANGIIDLYYVGFSLRYNPQNKTFTMPGFIEPAASIEDIKKSFVSRIADADELLSKEDLTEEEKEKITAFKEFYETFDDVWGSVDPWKIPFPSLPR